MSVIELFFKLKVEREKKIREYHQNNNIKTDEKALHQYLTDKFFEDLKYKMKSCSEEILYDMSNVIDISHFDLNLWNFEYSECRNYAGDCDYRRNRIRLSIKSFQTDYGATNDLIKEIFNTLAHELLHALNPKSGHKGEWKKQAKELNDNELFNKKYGDIKRCYSINENEEIENDLEELKN